MKRFDVATKAIIVNNDKFLAITRHDEDDFMAGSVDLPGGKLEFGEEPAHGLVREVKEETGLDIDVIAPIRTWTFMRDKNTQVVGMTFLCEKIGGSERLSKEHSGLRWVSLNDHKKEGFPGWLIMDIESALRQIR